MSNGELLCERGEHTGRLFLVLSGELEVLCDSREGTRLTVGTLTAGDVVGDVAELRGGGHTATVRAVGDVRLTAIPSHDFQALIEARTTPLEHLLHEIATHLGDKLSRAGRRHVEVLQRELDLSHTRNAMAGFLVYMVLGLAGYAVVMKVLSENGAPLANATIVSAPIMLVMSMIAVLWARGSGLPRHIFGLTWLDGWRHAREAVLWSLPVLGALTAVKWVVVHFAAGTSHLSLFPVLSEPFRAAPALGYGVYAALVPIQEFLSRGAVQGPMMEFLDGSERERWIWSILVSNALFGMIHLHLPIAYALVAFLGGFLWGILFARQRSLVGPVVSHVLIGVYALYFLGFADVLKGLH